MTTGPTLLELEAISKAFGARAVLREASLQLRAGEVVGLVGANGAGKTTMLRIAAGLIRPDEGYVFSSSRGLSLRYYGGESTLPPGVPVRRWAAFFGTSVNDRRAIAQLSRGSRQALGLRVVLGGREAGVVILDEPWEGLDADASAWATDAMRRWAEAGAALLVASHRLADLTAACTRRVLLEDGRCHVLSAMERQE